MTQPVVVPQLTPPSHGSTSGRLPDDVVLDGNVTDTPFTDVLDVVLKEVGRLRAGH